MRRALLTTKSLLRNTNTRSLVQRTIFDHISQPSTPFPTSPNVSIDTFKLRRVNPERFSSLAFEQIRPNIFQQIKSHPFIRLLGNGLLEQRIFKIYNSLDAEYLQCYRQTLDRLADHLRYQQDINIIRNFALSSLDEIYKDAQRRPLTFAAQDYINFLSNISQHGSPAEIAAAILPCFWLYQLLASEMKPGLGRMPHPYASWIERYSRPEFIDKVEFMRGLTDRLAEQSSPEIRSRMLAIFAEATQKEYNFWDSAYNLGTHSIQLAPPT